MKNYNTYWKISLLVCLFLLTPYLLSAQCWQDELPDDNKPWLAVYGFDGTTNFGITFYANWMYSDYTRHKFLENIETVELESGNNNHLIQVSYVYRETYDYTSVEPSCSVPQPPNSPADLRTLRNVADPYVDVIRLSSGGGCHYLTGNNLSLASDCSPYTGSYSSSSVYMGTKSQKLASIQQHINNRRRSSNSTLENGCTGTHNFSQNSYIYLIGILTEDGFIPALDENGIGVEDLDCEESCEYTNFPSLPPGDRKCFQYRKDGQLKTVCVNERGTLVDFKYDQESGKHDISLRDGINGSPCLIADDVDLLEDGTCVNSGTNNLTNNDVVCESCRPISKAPNCIAIRDQCGFTSYRCGFLGEGYFGAVKSSEMSVEIDSDPNQNDVQRVALTYSDGFEQEIYREQVPGSDWNKMALISQGYTNLGRCLDAPVVVGPTDGFRDLDRYPAARPNYSSASENMKCRTRLERGQAVETVCNSCSGIKRLFFSVANNFKVSFEAKPGENSPVKISAEITGENFTESFAAGCTERVYDGFADCNSPSSNLTSPQEEIIRVQEALNTQLNRSQLDEKIKVYPNPTNSSFKITFNLSNQELISYKITDLQGRTIGRSSTRTLVPKGSNTLLINDLSQAPKGIYLLRVKLGSQSFQTQRIIKM